MNPSIPMVDPAGEYRALKAEIDAAVGRVLASGRFVLGPEGEALEREIAQATEGGRLGGLGQERKGHSGHETSQIVLPSDDATTAWGVSTTSLSDRDLHPRERCAILRRDVVFDA